MFRLVLFPLLAASLTLPLNAQLSPDQRELDFRQLASVFAKRYAPYEWKIELFQFDLFQIEPWLKRVRAAANDIEYMEICAEYVASLRDTHTSFSVSTSLIARLPMFVDIYDGKVLIESLNPFDFTPASPRVETGDELVSIDGVPVSDLMDQFEKLRRRGSPSATRRTAADLLTWRPQSAYPRAIWLPETASVVIRKNSGEEYEFTVPWNRTGPGIERVGPVPMPRQPAPPLRTASPQQQIQDALAEIWNWSAPPNDPLLMGAAYDETTGQTIPRRYLLGYGQRNPVWNPPQGFNQRLGRVATDFHFSGTWEASGLRLGLIRIPNFQPPSTGLQEFEREISFMQQNTDGLVIDVMRNNGGGCYMLDVARRLIPRPFWFFGEEIRATRDRMLNMRALYDLAVSSRADQWVIDLFKAYADQIEQAHFESRGRTGPLPACVPAPASSVTTPPSFEQTPAAVVYTKPIIFLIDDFSTSAADIFPAMMQDNRRGPLVGTRTNGAGGSVSSWSLVLSENFVSNTNTLVVRKDPVSVPGYPVTRYIENVGAHADIPLDYMTRENLVTRGRPFVEAFTQILIDEIRRAAPQP